MNAARALAVLLGRRSARDPLGAAGERAAARMLRREGFRVLARNVRVPFGELDLLCLAPDREAIVGVEVKSRRVGAGGATAAPPPEAAASVEKRRRVRAIMTRLARANGWEGRTVRVDLVAVEFPPRGRPTFRHHVNVPDSV